MATVAELKKQAQELGIEIPSNANKAEIEALIAAHTTTAPEVTTSEAVETVATETTGDETTTAKKDVVGDESDSEETTGDETTTAKNNVVGTEIDSEETIGDEAPTPKEQETKAPTGNLGLQTDKVIEDEAAEVLGENQYRSENGNLYQFTKRTPKTLAVDSRTYELNQLLTDNEIMEDLIASKCIFIQKL